MVFSRPMGAMRQFPRVVWGICAGTFLFRLSNCVPFFLVLYLTGAEYSPAQAGTTLSVYGAGTILSAVAGGYLADTLGRRWTIVLSLLSGAIMLFSLPQAHTFGLIVLLAAVAGFAGEFSRTASAA